MNNRLQQFLELENITPARLADTLGVQRSGLSHILSGRNKPGYEFITKLLTKFPHINSEWLLLGKGKPYKEMMAGEGGTPSLLSSPNSGNSVYGKNVVSGSSDFAGNRIPYDSVLYDSIQGNDIPYSGVQNNTLQNNGVQYDDLQETEFNSSEDFEGIFPDTSDARTTQNSTYNSDNQNNTPQNSRFEPSENRVNGQNRADGGKKRKIKRVIIFYSDGSFEELFPHIG